MRLKLSHHDEHPSHTHSHAPSDLLAMAALLVAVLALALLIGASLSAMKISRDTLPAPVQGIVNLPGDGTGPRTHAGG